MLSDVTKRKKKFSERHDVITMSRRSHQEVQTNTPRHDVKKETSLGRHEQPEPLSTKHLMTEVPDNKDVVDIFSKEKDKNRHFNATGDIKQPGTAHEHFEAFSEKKLDTDQEHLNAHFDTSNDTAGDKKKFGTSHEYFEASQEKKPDSFPEHPRAHLGIYNDKKGLMTYEDELRDSTGKKKPGSSEILTTKATGTDGSQHNKELTATNDESKSKYEKGFTSSRFLRETLDQNNSSDPSDFSNDPSDVNKRKQKNFFLSMLKEILSSRTNLFPDMSLQDNGTNSQEGENTLYPSHNNEVPHENEYEEIPPTYEQAVEDASSPHEKAVNNEEVPHEDEHNAPLSYNDAVNTHDIPKEPPPSYEQAHGDPHDTDSLHEPVVHNHHARLDALRIHEQPTRGDNISSSRGETNKRRTSNSSNRVVSIKAGKSRGR